MQEPTSAATCNLTKKHPQRSRGSDSCHSAAFNSVHKCVCEDRKKLRTRSKVRSDLNILGGNWVDWNTSIYGLCGAHAYVDTRNRSSSQSRSKGMKKRPGLWPEHPLRHTDQFKLHITPTASGWHHMYPCSALSGVGLDQLPQLS